MAISECGEAVRAGGAAGRRRATLEDDRRRERRGRAARARGDAGGRQQARLDAAEAGRQVRGGCGRGGAGGRRGGERRRWRPMKSVARRSSWRRWRVRRATWRRSTARCPRCSDGSPARAGRLLRRWGRSLHISLAPEAQRFEAAVEKLLEAGFLAPFIVGSARDEKFAAAAEHGESQDTHPATRRASRTGGRWGGAVSRPSLRRVAVCQRRRTMRCSTPTTRRRSSCWILWTR